MRTGAGLLALSLSILLSSGISAQTSGTAPGPGEPAADAQANSPSGRITLRGCVSGGREAYTLLQTSTGAIFRLEGDAKQFDSLRGKLVEINGREYPPTSNTGVQEIPRLAIEKVQPLSDQCPFKTEGKGAAQATPTGTPQPQNKPPMAVDPRYAPNGAPDQTPPSVGNNPNIGGATGAPSPGTGNQPPPTPPPPK